MRTLLVVVILGALLGGCFGPATEPLTIVVAEKTFWLDLPVHVVAVGFDGFDAAALQAHLRQPQYMYGLLRGDVTGDIAPEPLQYHVDYMVHEAPETFATALFAYADTTVEEGPVTNFLRNYDLNGEARACTAATVPMLTEPTCDPVRRIDAEALEAWIADNRAAYDLDFAGPGYTVFLLDSYSKGYLPQDRYHQYRIDDGTINMAVQEQRAGGGSYDFVFMDVGAAPSDWDYRPWANYSRDAADLVDQIDEPIWDRTDSKGLYEDLGRNVVDATRMLWARMPIYPFEYATKYILPMYIFVDPEAHTHPDNPLGLIKPVDIEAQTKADVIEQAFADLAPWAEVELRLEFVYLPTDDPALAAAVQDAKTRSDGGYVDFGILKKYFHENWDDYVPQEPGARVYPTFAFWLGAPSQGLYAYSDSDHLGRSWGVFLNAADLWTCLRPTQPICFTEDIFPQPADWWSWWNAVLVHELGHSFGLTHPHDTGGLDEDGYTSYEINWLWDSTSTVMTYRHTIPTFNQFDKDLVLRGNAVGLATRVLAAEPTVALQEQALEALVLVQQGAYREALDLAAQTAVATGIPLIHDEEAALGLLGDAVQFRLEPLASESLAPRPPLPYGILPQPYLPPAEGVNYAPFPVDIPAGATSLRIEYREDDAALSHAGWYGYVMVKDTAGEVVAGLWNNGYDAAVLKAIDRCAAGCQGELWVWSGVATAYDVTLTPYFG